MPRMFSVACAVIAIAVVAGSAGAQAVPTAGSEFQRGQQQLQAGRFDDAAESFRQATEADPNNARAWFLHAYCLHAAGRLDEAVPAHRRAAEFPSQRPLALYNLGCAYSLLGRVDDAFDALGQAADTGRLDATQWAQDPDLLTLKEDARWAALLDRARAGVTQRADQALRFWIGEWDVYNTQGIKVGDNSITLRSGGRVIYESWKSTSGGVGESFNYFDPVDGLWHQVWVDTRGNVLRMSGVFSDGALRFAGDAHSPDGGTASHRTTLTAAAGRPRPAVHRAVL